MVSAAATCILPPLCDFYDTDERNKVPFKEHTGHKSKDDSPKNVALHTGAVAPFITPLTTDDFR